MAVLGPGQVHAQDEHQVGQSISQRAAHDGNGGIAVVYRGGTQQVLSLSVSGLGVSDGTTFTDVLSDTPTPLTVTGGTLSVTVPAKSAIILIDQ